MATPPRPDFNVGRVQVPEVGSVFADFADRQAKQYQIGLENERKQAQIEEDKKRYETELGFKQRQEQRLVDELGREQATREAILANLNPDRFKEAKLREIDTAIAQGMANLSPQERAEAEAQVKANWDRTGSGNFALGLARDSTLADPSKVLSAQKSRLDIALSDPNSPESKALREAELDMHSKKLGATSASNFNLFKQQQAYADSKEEKEAEKYSKYMQDMFNLSDKKIVPGEGPKVIEDGVVNQDAITAYDNALITESNRFNELFNNYKEKAPTTKSVTKGSPGTSVTKKVEEPLSEDEKNKWAYDKAYGETLGKINYNEAPKEIRGRVEVPATPGMSVNKTPQEQILDRVALMQKHGLSATEIKAEMKKILPDPMSKKDKAELEKINAQTMKALAEANKAQNDKGSKKTDKTIPKDIGEKIYDKLGSSDGPATLKKYETIAKSKNIPLQDVYNILDNALQPTTESFWFYNVDEDTYDGRVLDMLKQRYPNKF